MEAYQKCSQVSMLAKHGVCEKVRGVWETVGAQPVVEIAVVARQWMDAFAVGGGNVVSEDSVGTGT